ncbi:unnamed protein product [Medioppia subpectinata]|uniref:Uncharacterized protein n=1 Tax=Medioppia subpectinata TaxID=1979941 RepID=A0A7R9KID4_9ACAR|nr:unnamed protein product [Medioppia subpectinata]CAG2104057.1 unnamed protein product [Medioppia subpectinata]
MCNIHTTCLINVLLMIILIHSSDQALKKDALIDYKSGKALPLQTLTDYALQNQKTKKWLIWGQKGAIAADKPDPKDNQYWHNFTFLTQPTGNYYRMFHGSGGIHVTHVSVAPNAPGYYWFYNKDCPMDHGSDNPNCDWNADGYIWCQPPAQGADARPVPIIDRNTGDELQLKTNTYYAIQNQRTSKFLIWFGKTGTISEDLDVKKAKFWHIFHKLDNGWYKMMHHFNSHTVRIGKSHDEGFYHIYNKDCFNAEHPNADADINGTIMCFIPSVKTDYLEFNWRFLEKQTNKKSIPVNDKSVDSTSSRHPNPLFKALIPLFALVIIGIAIYVIKLRGNSFQGSPTTVLYNHSNPAYAPDMPVTHDPPPYIPQQSYNNTRLY